MGWQADHDPRRGEVPGPGERRPASLAGFGHGGAQAGAPPSAALAAALEAAAGPDELYEGAGTDELVGAARQWAAVESWAAAGKLGALRAMMREDGRGTPLLRRRGDLPEGWDDSLNYEVAGALAVGPVSAGNLAGLAWALGSRLPGTGRLLADGTLTLAKARLIVAVFEPLDGGEAARAEALIVGEVGGKTYFQVERLAWRAALAVAPDVAERRRVRAERERARVTVFREESGAVGLSGRDLPAGQALAGHASVVARARVYEASGAFPGQAMSGLEALAYLHLLNGVTAGDAIAFARAAAAEPPDDGPGDSGPDHGGPEDGHDDGGFDDRGPDDRGPDDRGPDDRGSDDAGPDDGGPEDGPDDGGPDGGNEASRGEAGGRGGDPGGGGGRGDDEDPGHGANQGGGPGPGGGGRAGGEGPGSGGNSPGPGPGPGGGGEGPGSGGSHSVLPEVTVPLATLQGRAARAGESRLLGPLDPAMARDLAAAAARSPSSRWEVTVVDERGYATGHGIARPGRGRRPTPGQPEPEQPVPACCALPARVNVTVTETRLRQLADQPAQPRPGAPPGDWALVPQAGAAQSRSGAPPGDWALAARAKDTWTFTLPGGRELAVRFDVVPTHDCDHQHQVSGYEPSERLRRLVQVRDRECTFPPCSRPAKNSDFEHAVPYDQGGRTCGCNAGARSRRCHQVKQAPGWTVTQPKPGWHVWTTPTGRTYTQEPWRYIA